MSSYPWPFFLPHFALKVLPQLLLSIRIIPFRFSTGITGASGYDAVAAEALVDKRSSNETWRARQKEHLERCSAMLDDNLAAEKQSVFMLSCWHGSKMADCKKQRLVAAAVAVDPENGGEVAEAVATMAEGQCVHRHMSYSEKVTKVWNKCASANNLNMNVLTDTGYYYKEHSSGFGVPPALSSRFIASVANELEKMDAASECYASASGEVSSDGTINYDKMTEKIENAEAKPEFKKAAKKLLEYCRSKKLQNIGNFYDCYMESQPLICDALGREGPGGQGRGRESYHGGRGRRLRQGWIPTFL